MDTVTMIKTIQAAFIQNAHSFKQRIIRKMKKRIDILERAIEQNTNAPLLVDTTKHVETLQIELPIKNLQEFISFDNIVSKNPQKIEALKTLMTVATRRSADIKEAIPNKRKRKEQFAVQNHIHL